MTLIPISILVFVVSAFLFSRAAGSLSPVKPNPISYIFYYNILLQTFIGTNLIFLGIDQHYAMVGIEDQIRFKGWLAVCYLMVALPSGMLIAKWLLSSRVRVRFSLNRYAESGVKPLDPSTKIALILFSFISFFSVIYNFYSLGYYPFLPLFFENSSELLVLRGEATREFSGNVYIRNFFALMLAPILSYIWVVSYVKSKDRVDFVMMFVSLLFSISILYYNFAKGPLLWYFVGFTFLAFYVKGRLDVRILGFVGVLVGAGVLAFYLNSGNSLYTIFGKYYSGPIGRVILSQVSGLYWMFEIFPGKHDFIGFQSISHLLANIFEYDYVDRAARIAMAEFNPGGVKAGEAGVMSTVFLGEAWANFGLIGIILSPLWVGFLVYSVYWFFLSFEKNAVTIGFFVAFSISGVSGGFNHYIYNPLFMMIVLWLLCLFFVSFLIRKIKMKLYRRKSEVTGP